MMTSTPTILIVGGTGMQGSAVAYRLLRHGRFRVRVMTRDPDGARAPPARCGRRDRAGRA